MSNRAGVPGSFGGRGERGWLETPPKSTPVLRRSGWGISIRSLSTVILQNRMERYRGAKTQVSVYANPLFSLPWRVSSHL